MSVTAFPTDKVRAKAREKARAKARAGVRAFWMRQIRQWHWISSALCLVGMLAFAVTGITLNHAGAIPAKPVVTHRTAVLPAPLMRELARGPATAKAPLPPAVRAWMGRAVGASLPPLLADWSREEVYLALPRPGGDAWTSVDRQTGAVEYERTTRGWLAVLNDLHKGRNAGPGWGWFIDAFAVAVVVFSGTGLALLYLHAGARRWTWPLVGAGLAIPLLVFLLLVHL